MPCTKYFIYRCIWSHNFTHVSISLVASPPLATGTGKSDFAVCPLSVREAKAAYPGLLDVPYACMDLVYEYTPLVDGFGLAPTKEITLVEKVKHGEYLMKAAWPLGEAIEAVAPKKRVA